MRNNLLKTLLLFSLISFQSFSQGFGDYIAENAIKVDSSFSLDSSVYRAIEDYQLILVGEMHGTNEPAKLVESLSMLIRQHENSISIGIEIPTNEMEAFVKHPSDSTLKQTTFFTKENTDGRNGEAWFKLISSCCKDTSIHLFFYDNSREMNITSRDSAMYATIVQQHAKYPNDKIITLSGNIHNRLLPFNNNPTMGNYCLKDSLNFNAGSICSINHYYAEGTMLNNFGNGLELKVVPFEESIFTTSSPHKNYLLFYETAEPSEHNCIFFTRKVTHSPKLEDVE